MDERVSYTRMPVNNFNKIKMTIKKIAKKYYSDEMVRNPVEHEPQRYIQYTVRYMYTHMYQKP